MKTMLVGFAMFLGSLAYSTHAMGCTIFPQPYKAKAAMLDKLEMKFHEATNFYVSKPKLYFPVPLKADCSGLYAAHYSAGFKVRDVFYKHYVCDVKGTVVKSFKTGKVKVLVSKKVNCSKYVDGFPVYDKCDKYRYKHGWCDYKYDYKYDKYDWKHDCKYDWHDKKHHDRKHKHDRYCDHRKDW